MLGRSAFSIAVTILSIAISASSYAENRVLAEVTPALATTTTNVAVSSPTAGAAVRSPFSLVASGTLCQGQAIAAMGYSLDANTGSTFSGNTLNTSVNATTGSHTVYIKSWGNGIYCVRPVSINVIPSNAEVVWHIEELTNWTAVHDAATPGTSIGTTTLVSSPVMSGSARRFHTDYTNYGGERYNSHLPVDETSTHFLYDAHIYIPSGSRSDIAIVEMDLNQVMPSGERVVFGFQCNSWAHTWDYADSSGYTDNEGRLRHWIHSNRTCDVQKWATNTWHHVQIQYSRDDSGNVTYKAVWFDGVEQYINATVPGVHYDRWAPQLSTNFQVDGYSSTSGSSTIYLDKLTLYKW